MSEKRCTKCGASKPRTEFANRGDSRDGLQTHCRECVNTRRRNWERAHPEAARARERRANTLRPEVFRARGARTNARRAGAPDAGVSPLQLVALWEEYGQRCAYCAADHDLQLDHIAPLSKGGWNEIGNCAPACASCNNSKNARTLLEWLIDRRVKLLQAA